MVFSQQRSSVRSAGRRARQSIDGDERRVREEALVGHLLSVAALAHGSVGVFVAHDGEPDLMPLIRRLWDKDQLVGLPVLADDPADHTMRFVHWEPHGKLVPGRYDIPVPAKPHVEMVPATVLVSLTAFDAAGNRMGRGGGFFDRFLGATNTLPVGVAFEAQRVAVIPVQAHDVPMAVMVTDLGVRFCSPGQMVA